MAISRRRAPAADTRRRGNDEQRGCILRAARTLADRHGNNSQQVGVWTFDRAWRDAGRISEHTSAEVRRSRADILLPNRSDEPQSRLVGPNSYRSQKGNGEWLTHCLIGLKTRITLNSLRFLCHQSRCLLSGVSSGSKTSKKTVRRAATTARLRPSS